MAIIRFLCYWGMTRRLKLLFLDVIEDKSFHLLDLLEEIKHKNSIAVDGLVKALISVKEFDKAYDVVSKINRLSVFTCNLFMNVLVEQGKVGMAMAVLKMNGLTPNSYTCGIMVKGLCNAGYLKKGATFIQSMKKDGVEPNSFTFGSYIHGLCSNGYTDSASELLKSLKAIDHVFAYACVIRGFVKESKLQDAEKVFFDMKQGKTQTLPDVYCYGALIEGYCRNREIVKALDLHDEMCSEGGIDTNCVIVSSILQCLCNLGLWSEAVYRFITAFESGVNLDEISFNIAMDALCKLGRTGKARLLLQVMKKSKAPDVQHYTTLIHGFCLRKELDIALEILDEMINGMGLKPDTVTFNVLIGGFAKRGLVDKTNILLKDMVSRGLQPTTATYNTVIQGLCQAGKSKEARLFFNNLETKTLDNYIAIIKGCCDTNDLQDAYQLFLTFLKQGKEGLLMATKAGSRCLKQLFSCFCEEGDTDRALVVFKTILDVDDDDDGKMMMMMYSQLQSAYCKAKNVKMARWVFDTMIARGLRPDLISYTIMLRGYLRVKWLTEAHHLLKNMIRDGIQPDVICYTVLLRHYSKLDNLEAAVWLLNKIKNEQGLKLDVIAHTIMLRGYLRLNLLTEARDLLMDMIGGDGIRPDVICYTVLLDHYLKSFNLKFAKRVFKHMKDEGLKPDAKAYASLFYNYYHGDYYIEGVQLYVEMLSQGFHRDTYFQVEILVARLIKMHWVKYSIWAELTSDRIQPLMYHHG